MSALPDTLPPGPALAPADLRAAGILASARRAFVEKGFDGASMQDLARTAGMSVGNFYRYFPSKAAIVAALIEQDIVEMSTDFAAILRAPDPRAALRAKVRERLLAQECVADGALWAEMSAAALRKEDIRRLICGLEAEIVANLVRVFARIAGLGEAAVPAEFGTRAMLFVMLVKGTAMQPPSDRRDDLVAMVLRMIDAMVDDLANPAPKV
jgi:AcrR family transcriptional regulator